MAGSTAARMRLRRASAVVIALGVAGLLMLIAAFVLRGSLAAGGGAAGSPRPPATAGVADSLPATRSTPGAVVSVPPLTTASQPSVPTGTLPSKAPSAASATSETSTPPLTSSPSPASVASAPPTPTLALPALDPAFESVLGVHGAAKVIYLTFDDGPGPQTPQILDVLKANGVLATFCQVGDRIDDYAATEQRMVAEGHTLCNHSVVAPGQPRRPAGG